MKKHVPRLLDSSILLGYFCMRPDQEADMPLCDQSCSNFDFSSIYSPLLVVVILAEGMSGSLNAYIYIWIHVTYILMISG